jgi:hypothetical protein
LKPNQVDYNHSLIEVREARITSQLFEEKKLTVKIKMGPGGEKFLPGIKNLTCV